MKRERFGLKAAQTNHKGNKFHQSKFGVQISIFLVDLGASIAGNYSTNPVMIVWEQFASKLILVVKYLRPHSLARTSFYLGMASLA